MTMRRNRMWWRAALMIPGLIMLSGLTAQASPSSASVPNRQVVSASSPSTSDDKGVTVTCPAGKRLDWRRCCPRRQRLRGHRRHHPRTAQRDRLRVRVPLRHNRDLVDWGLGGLRRTEHDGLHLRPEQRLQHQRQQDRRCQLPSRHGGPGHRGRDAQRRRRRPRPRGDSDLEQRPCRGLRGRLESSSGTGQSPRMRSAPRPRRPITSQRHLGQQLRSRPARQATSRRARRRSGRLQPQRLPGPAQRRRPDPTSVGNILSHANELVATTNNWSITTTAICATA